MYVCLYVCITQPNHEITNQTSNPITTTSSNNNIKQAILQTSQRAKNSPFIKIILSGSQKNSYISTKLCSKLNNWAISWHTSFVWKQYENVNIIGIPQWNFLSTEMEEKRNKTRKLNFSESVSFRRIFLK